MSGTTTVVKGGLVVSSEGAFEADVAIEDGVIASIARSFDGRADTTFDARGRYVLPGCVDPHTHLEMPFQGTTTCDDFFTGTVAAAFGGTTSVVDFCIQQHGQAFGDALDAWHAKAGGRAVVDYGFHLAITDFAGGELADVVAAGVTSIKLFMAYRGELMVDDLTMFAVLRAAAAEGALVMVHAENGDAIDTLVRAARERGCTAPVWHGRTRPPETEAEATNRAIMLARVAGASLYVVHVSCEAALTPLRRARADGWRVTGETCPQYLFTDESCLDAPGFAGAKYVFTPPPRRPADQDALWSALARDELSVISTDHCPFRLRDQKVLGRDDFSKIPNGAPGIEERLMLIHHFGVGSGRLTLPRMVELLATAPARHFGLYPRKGTLAVGSDADVVIFDPHRRRRLGVESSHSEIDYSLYEGIEVIGTPETVIVRGEVVIDHDELVAGAGGGRFLERTALPFASTPALEHA